MNDYMLNQSVNINNDSNEINWLKKAEYASAAAMQGLSLGFSDEIEGALGALGYGVGAMFNPNESIWDAARRGYVRYRDNRRSMLEDGRVEAKGVMNLSEFVSSLASPVPTKLFKPISRFAPSSVKYAAQVRDAFLGGGIYGLGKASGNFGNHLWEATKGATSAFIGNQIVNKIPREFMLFPFNPHMRNMLQRSLENASSELSKFMMDNIQNEE